MKTAEFGVPCKAPEPGRCRICGCTRITACDVQTDYGSRACGWTDETQTLCDLPACIEAARAELTTHPQDDPRRCASPNICFCGAIPRLMPDGNGRYWFVKCGECDRASIHSRTREEAVQAWNEAND